MLRNWHNSVFPRNKNSCICFSACQCQLSYSISQSTLLFICLAEVKLRCRYVSQYQWFGILPGKYADLSSTQVALWFTNTSGSPEDFPLHPDLYMKMKRSQFWKELGSHALAIFLCSQWRIFWSLFTPVYGILRWIGVYANCWWFSVPDGFSRIRCPHIYPYK